MYTPGDVHVDPESGYCINNGTIAGQKSEVFVAIVVFMISFLVIAFSFIRIRNASSVWVPKFEAQNLMITEAISLQCDVEEKRRRPEVFDNGVYNILRVRSLLPNPFNPALG